MTTLPALMVPGTILATAALTSQEALAAVSWQDVARDLKVEASNFTTVALRIGADPSIAELIHSNRKGDEQYLGRFIQECSSAILRFSENPRLLRDEVLTQTCNLRDALLQISLIDYGTIIERVVRSGRAVFGHQAPAVSSPVASADSGSENAKRRIVLFLIEEMRKANKSADSLLIFLSQARNESAVFTLEHVEVLNRIFEKEDLDPQLATQFRLILTNLQTRRPDLFPV